MAGAGGDAVTRHADKVIAALGKRISEQGDMHIRVSRHTLRVLFKVLGIEQWELGDDEFREIDGLALDALRFLAWRKR